MELSVGRAILSRSTNVYELPENQGATSLPQVPAGADLPKPPTNATQPASQRNAGSESPAPLKYIIEFPARLAKGYLSGVSSGLLFSLKFGYLLTDPAEKVMTTMVSRPLTMAVSRAAGALEYLKTRDPDAA